MARPLKEYKTKIVNTSLTLYHKGVYVGSIPLAELYRIIEARKGNGKE